MDRNLGARDPKRAVDGVGSLMYQFGRKDPIAGGISGLVTTAYKGRGYEGDNDLWTIEAITGSVSTSKAAENPMCFYKPGNGLNWCIGIDSATYVWNDFEQDIEDNGKSIFDPSPKGWKVPAQGVFGDFTHESMSIYSETENLGRGYPLEDPFAYFFAQGLRYAGSGTVSDFSARISYWVSTPGTTTQSYHAYFFLTSIGTGISSAGRGTGRHLRPVQHDE